MGDLYNIDCFDEVDLNEMRYYQSLYPKVEDVREKRVHCTSCDKHIGTAPINEFVVCMHSVLRVTQCIECYNFYNSGDFDTDEDGSELYCRWCGQGGEVYCCTKCPYVFCHKCIALNLSPSCATDIENNENWICFACSPKMLMDLRAQHWALVNYMEKQKQEYKTQTKDNSELDFLMDKDLSTCCENPKSDACTSESTTMKRKNSEEDVNVLPTTKKIITQKEVNQVMASTTTIKNEEDVAEVAPTPTPTSKPIQIVQAPQVLPSLHPIQCQVTVRRQVAPPVIRPTLATITPVYHTINGCRYNLSTTGQQNTYQMPTVGQQSTYQLPSVGQQNAYRLPDGKIIQIVKQTLDQNQQVTSFQVPRNLVIRPANINVQRLAPVSAQPLPPPPPLMIPIHNNIPPLIPTKSFPVQNNQSNTLFTAHRAQLESRIKNSLEVCQQIISKINLFTNAAAFQNAKTIKNIKDLNVHFTCLVTYAIGSFKNLQEKCTDDMTKLVKVKKKRAVKPKTKVKSQPSPKIGLVECRNRVDSDDDVSIVEPPKSIITVESDNEENEENDAEKVLKNIEKIQEEFLGKWVDDSSQKTPADVNNEKDIINDEKLVAEPDVPIVEEVEKEDESQNYDSHGVDIKMEFEEEIEQINETTDIDTLDSTEDDEELKNNENFSSNENSPPDPLIDLDDRLMPGDEEPSSPAKGLLQRKTPWQEQQIFHSVPEVLEMISSENTWSRTYQNITATGKQVRYRCNKVVEERVCSAAINVHYDSKSTEIVLYRTPHNHHHQLISTPTKNGLSGPMKIEIRKLYDLNLKLNDILSKLEEKFQERPSKNQIKHYISALKKEKYGNDTISHDELKKLLIAHSAVPDSDTTPFVFKHEIFGTELDSIEQGFRFFITTKSLISLAMKGTILHTDSTYKQIWQGSPVLAIGTTDADHCFHPFGLAVCNGEEFEDFWFLFESIKSACETLHNFDYKPRALMADPTAAIGIAFANVFGNSAVVLTCFSHVKKHIRKKLSPNMARRTEILTDIENLQLSSSETIFGKALPLFLAKWKAETSFVTYFEEEWVDKFPNWYEGACTRAPSTNNSLESFNMGIRNAHIFRERWPLQQFLKTALDTVEKLSKDYTTGQKIFSEQATPDLKMWTNAFQFAKENRKIMRKLVKENNKEIKFKIFATGASDATDVNENYNSFEEFTKNNFAIWTTTYPDGVDNWQSGMCNCPSYMKKFMCIHVLGMAIRLKKSIEPPEEFKKIIAEKLRRGRHLNARKAVSI